MRIVMLFLTSASCLSLGVCTEAQARPVPYLRLAHSVQHQGCPADCRCRRRQSGGGSGTAGRWVRQRQPDLSLHGWRHLSALCRAGKGQATLRFSRANNWWRFPPATRRAGLSAIPTAEAAATRQVHVLVKPYAAGLKTNLVITTDRRTYHLQLESTPATAMAAISWSYPQDALIALQAAQVKSEAAAPVATGIAVDNLHFGYVHNRRQAGLASAACLRRRPKDLHRIPGDPGPGGGAAAVRNRPGRTGRVAELPILHNYYVADRLFAVAELRLGGKHQSIVRITRTDQVIKRGGGHD